jgi:hypothetical protein
MPAFCREQCIQKIDDYVREHRHLSTLNLEKGLFKDVAVKKQDGSVYAVWSDTIKDYMAELRRLIEYKNSVI